MTVLATILMAFGAMALVAGLSLILAFPLKWTWNYCMPYIFNLPIIEWGHAWCLSFISTWLIKSHNFSSGSKK